MTHLADAMASWVSSAFQGQPEVRRPGTRILTWDSRAAGITSGIYFARLRVNGRELSQRIVILD